MPKKNQYGASEMPLQLFEKQKRTDEYVKPLVLNNLNTTSNNIVFNCIV